MRVYGNPNMLLADLVTAGVDAAAVSGLAGLMIARRNLKTFDAPWLDEVVASRHPVSVIHGADDYTVTHGVVSDRMAQRLHVWVPDGVADMVEGL